MSLLARSLLALAATLAVATAVPQSRWLRLGESCGQADIGERGDPRHDVVISPVDSPCRSGLVGLDDNCERNYYYCGEHVEACYPGDGPPPSIALLEAGTLQPLTITCNDPNQKKATVKMVQHCCPDPYPPGY